MAESGFRKKMYAFAPIPHSVCQDKNLSDKALGMYCRIFSYIHIPNFELTKSFLMSVSPSGETAFNSEWKELKEKGYLKQFRICDKKGVFRYEYDLMDKPDLTTPYLINVGTNGEVTSDSNSEKAEVDTPQNHPPQNHPYGRHTGGKIGYPNKNKQIRISNNKELNISNDIFNEKDFKNDDEEVEHRFLRLHNDPVDMDSTPGEEIFMGVGENLPAPGEDFFMGGETLTPCGTKTEEPFFSPNNTINNTSNNIKKEEPQKKSSNSYEKIIDTYTDNPNLKETILEFIKMRKLKKKPPTDKALALILKKLDKLSNTTSGKIEILEQSIIRCYEDVFEIKQDYKSQYGKQNKEPTGMDALKELADEWGVQLP